MQKEILDRVGIDDLDHGPIAAQARKDDVGQFTAGAAPPRLEQPRTKRRPFFVVRSPLSTRLRQRTE